MSARKKAVPEGWTFTVSRSDMTAALARVEPARHTGGNPILHGVHIEATGSALNLTATNMDLRISTTIEATGDAGTVIVAVEMLSRLLSKKGTPELVFTVGEDAVHLTSGRAAASVPIIKDFDGDWPTFPQLKGAKVVTLTEDYLTAIGRVRWAASHDNTKLAILHGVVFDGTTVYAVDGNKMACHPIGSALCDDVIVVPGDVLGHVLKHAGDGGVKAKVGSNKVMFKAGDTTWTVGLLTGEPAKIEAIIKAGSKSERVTVNVAEMLETLDRMTAVLDGPKDITPLVATITDNTITIRRASAEMGHIIEDVPADTGGVTLEAFGLQLSLFHAMLSACNEDDAAIGFGTGLMPILLQDGDLTAVIMPVRLTAAWRELAMRDAA